MGTTITWHVKHASVVGLPLCRLGREYDNGNGPILHDVLEQLPNVMELTLHNVDIDAYLPLDYPASGIQRRPFSHLFPTSTLRTHCIAEAMFHSVHDVSRLIATFPLLDALTIKRPRWWQDAGVPLQDQESEYTNRTLRGVTYLSLFSTPTQEDILRKIEKFPYRQSRQFEWTAYILGERRLFREMLRASAAHLRELDLFARLRLQDLLFSYSNDLLTSHSVLMSLDTRIFTSIRCLNLVLRASPYTQDPFCDALPAFVTCLNTTRLRTLALHLNVFRPADTYWTFIDWPALDDALAALHACRPTLFIVFRIMFTGLTVDIAGALIEDLRGALGAGMRIGPQCDLDDHGSLTQGEIRWLGLNRQ
ncbi:hypothetical protein C8Q72DRAFT_886477 [Fomitopsis betulina]|nr:hypothetical protein C8Q72DRAFT_886477 [Fomitopsis betulina]